MQDFISYLIKIIICSGIFYTYYFLALRSKKIFQWNRFFLISSVLLSMVIPLINFDWESTISNPGRNFFVALLDFKTDSPKYLHAETEIDEAGHQISYLGTIYLCVITILATIMIISLLRLLHIYRSSEKIKSTNGCIVMTEDKNAPFTFFRLIFWNMKFSLKSPDGMRIFNHEMIHVKQRHSFDNTFINLVAIVFWCNPFYWLIRKELRHIHEFIADARTVDNEDTDIFSRLILSAYFPIHPFNAESQFFGSSIKRRLSMLKSPNTPVSNFVLRTLSFPVLIIVFCFFSNPNPKTIPAVNKLTKNINSKPLLIVVDAGHGGKELGVVSADGLLEKDVNLSIAKEIVELSRKQGIRVKLTREDDATIPIRDRVATALEETPDLFISIHISSAAPKVSGFEFVVPKEGNIYQENTRLYSSILSQEFKKNFEVSGELARKENVYVLDSRSIKYPSLLIELGNIKNTNDVRILADKRNHEIIAGNILDAALKYEQVRK